MSELPPEEAFPEPSRFVKKAKRAVKNALAGKAGLLCAVAVVFAAGWAYSVNWSEVGASLATARPTYSYDPAVLAEAKALDLDYDTVSANPAAYAGKPVLWCLVKQAGTQRPFVDGNMAWMVNLEGGDIEAVPTGRMAPCKFTLARVEKTAVPGVNLTFIAHL